MMRSLSMSYFNLEGETSKGLERNIEVIVKKENADLYLRLLWLVNVVNFSICPVQGAGYDDKLRALHQMWCLASLQVHQGRTHPGG